MRAQERSHRSAEAAERSGKSSGQVTAPKERWKSRAEVRKGEEREEKREELSRKTWKEEKPIRASQYEEEKMESKERQQQWQCLSTHKKYRKSKEGRRTASPQETCQTRRREALDSS